VVDAKPLAINSIPLCVQTRECLLLLLLLLLVDDPPLG
jgi:hypothetical protein